METLIEFFAANILLFCLLCFALGGVVGAITVAAWMYCAMGEADAIETDLYRDAELGAEADVRHVRQRGFVIIDDLVGLLFIVSIWFTAGQLDPEGAFGGGGDIDLPGPEITLDQSLVDRGVHPLGYPHVDQYSINCVE